MEKNAIVVVLPIAEQFFDQLRFLRETDQVSISWLPIADGKTEYIASEVHRCECGKHDCAKLDHKIGTFLSLQEEIFIDVRYLKELLPGGELKDLLKKV